jgi:hypothetical protein
MIDMRSIIEEGYAMHAFHATSLPPERVISPPFLDKTFLPVIALSMTSAGTETTLLVLTHPLY